MGRVLLSWSMSVVVWMCMVWMCDDKWLGIAWVEHYLWSMSVEVWMFLV